VSKKLINKASSAFKVCISLELLLLFCTKLSNNICMDYWFQKYCIRCPPVKFYFGNFLVKNKSLNIKHSEFLFFSTTFLDYRFCQYFHVVDFWYAKQEFLFVIFKLRSRYVGGLFAKTTFVAF
jgi:hypothetical protein